MRRIPSGEDRAGHEGQLEAELADGDLPGVGREAELEDDLRDDGVDSGIKHPTFDRKGKHRVCKVGVVAEKDVGDEAIVATPAFCEWSG